MSKPILKFSEVATLLKTQPKTWLITGAAGFIGSNLCSKLLDLGQNVIGIDNFSTGHQHNIDFVKADAEKSSGSFDFFKCDTRDKEALSNLPQNFDFINHQAALGSVPRSFANPEASHDSNVNGFVNIIELARKNKTPLVYACLLYTSPSPRDLSTSRMPSSA